MTTELPTSPSLPSWSEHQDPGDCPECEKRQKQVGELVALLKECADTLSPVSLSSSPPLILRPSALYLDAFALITRVEEEGY